MDQGTMRGNQAPLDFSISKVLPEEAVYFGPECDKREESTIDETEED